MMLVGLRKHVTILYCWFWNWLFFEKEVIWEFDFNIECNRFVVFDIRLPSFFKQYYEICFKRCALRTSFWKWNGGKFVLRATRFCVFWDLGLLEIKLIGKEFEQLIFQSRPFFNFKMILGERRTNFINLSKGRNDYRTTLKFYFAERFTKEKKREAVVLMVYE